MDFDAQFNKIYDHVSDSIAFGNCQEMVFEDIDTALAIIWDQENSTSGIYDSLETDEEKVNFLKDFKSAAEWLMGWNRGNLSDKELHDLAKDILLERKA